MPHAHHASVEFFWISAGLILAALIYLRGLLRLRRLDLDSVEAWHTGGFILGLFLIWLATASPLSSLDHESLTAHMVQHLLLMTFAPPLILLVAWHIPAVFVLGLRSQMWHGIEQVSFLASGLLFWWPVVQPWRSSSKWPESSLLVYLFLTTLPCDILSGFLVFCERVVYPVYFSSSQPFGLSALEDQQCAGALMWTCVTVVYLIAGAIVTARLLSPHSSQEYAILQSQTQTIGLPKSDAQRMEAL